jgi:hypothetical protein
MDMIMEPRQAHKQHVVGLTRHVEVVPDEEDEDLIDNLLTR